MPEKSFFFSDKILSMHDVLVYAVCNQYDGVCHEQSGERCVKGTTAGYFCQGIPQKGKNQREQRREHFHGFPYFALKQQNYCPLTSAHRA